jgi:hypothetical protein
MDNTKKSAKIISFPSDRLFVLTAKYNVMILEVENDDAGGFEIRTIAVGDVSDKIGKNAESGKLKIRVFGSLVEPQPQLFALAELEWIRNAFRFRNQVWIRIQHK